METFVLRIWVPGEERDGVVADDLHGLLEHVTSGRTERFHDSTELLAYIANVLRLGPSPATVEGDGGG